MSETVRQTAVGTNIFQASDGAKLEIRRDVSSKEFESWLHQPDVVLLQELASQFQDVPQHADQFAIGSLILQAIGPGSEILMVLGHPTEKVEELVRASGEEAQATITELRVTRQILAGFINSFKRAGLPSHRFSDILFRVAQQHQGLLGLLAMPDPKSPVANQFRRQAGEYLKHAESKRDYELVREWLEMAERTKHAADRQENAALKAELAELSLIELDYIRASHDFLIAAEIVAIDDLEKESEYLLRAAIALRYHGDEKANNRSLEKAIELFRKIASRETRLRKLFRWAQFLNLFLNTLQTLGEREGGTEYLTEAVLENRKVLDQCDKTKERFEWAMFQNNLGNALLALGERGIDTVSIKLAVKAYTKVLLIYTETSHPLHWGATQNNLGTALQVLGERKESRQILKSASRACRKAIRVFEQYRAQAPLDRAMSYNGLGNALLSQARLEVGTWHIMRAVTAYERALTGCRRDEVPLHWAGVRNNLGTAFEALAVRMQTPEPLVKAYVAYWDALAEFQPERGPLDWAMVHRNIAELLAMLGDCYSSLDLLYGAIISCRKALKEYTQERIPLQHAATNRTLNRLLESLDKRGADSISLCSESMNSPHLTTDAFDRTIKEAELYVSFSLWVRQRGCGTIENDIGLRWYALKGVIDKLQVVSNRTNANVLHVSPVEQLGA